MINDILFCLLGYTGGVFREGLEESNGFTITNTIDCITESEKDLLKKIGNLGYKYKLLKDFVRNYDELSNLNMMKGFGIIGSLNNFENYDEKTKELIVNYMKHMDTIERQAYTIGKAHLGSSFNIVKSNGFINWKKNLK